MRPQPRDFHAAIGTFAFPGDVIFTDDIAAPSDQAVVAVGAKRIFIFSHLSRQIARVHEAQSGFVPDLRRAQKRSGIGVVGVGHFVVLVECCHVPWDILGDARDEARRIPELFI